MSCPRSFTVECVTMKVKFPCKMMLQHCGVSISPQVARSEANCYRFKQQVTIDSDSDTIDIVVNLLTDKNAKYIAGTISISSQELHRGEHRIIPIKNTIDPQATCEIFVSGRIISEPREVWNVFSPLRAKETRSEANFPLKKNTANDFNEITARDVNTNVQAEVYREGYEKLREKYRREVQTVKKESYRRTELENNESQMKLQLMKSGLRCEELERVVGEKNAAIKQLRQEIGRMGQLQLGSSHLEGEIAKRNKSINVLQERAREAERKLKAALEGLAREEYDSQEAIRNLQGELYSLKERSEFLQRQLEMDLHKKGEAYLEKERECAKLEAQLETERSAAVTTEDKCALKIRELETVIEDGKVRASKTAQESKVKAEQHQKDIAQWEKERKKSNEEKESLRMNALKSQYEAKLARGENQAMRGELEECRQYKLKHNELVRTKMDLTEERQALSQQLEKAFSTIEGVNAAAAKQKGELSQKWDRLQKDYEERLNSLNYRLLESELRQLSSRESQQSEAKSIAGMNRDLQESRTREKEARKLLKRAEMQLEVLNNELCQLKSKQKDADVLKGEMERYRTESIRMKEICERLTLQGRQLHQQSVKTANEESGTGDRCGLLERDLRSLKEKKREIEMELERVRNEGDAEGAKFEDTLKRVKGEIAQLRDEKKAIEVASAQSSEQIMRLKNEYQSGQMKIRHYETTLEANAVALEALGRAKNELEARVDILQREVDKGRTGKMGAEYDKQTIAKMNEHLQEQLGKNKEETEGVMKKLQEKEDYVQQLREQLDKITEENMRYELSLTNLKKEIGRNKSSLQELLCKLALSLGGTVKTYGQKKTETSEQVSSMADIMQFVGQLGRELKQGAKEQSDRVARLEREKDAIQQASIFQQKEDQQNHLSQLAELRTQLNIVQVEWQQYREESEFKASHAAQGLKAKDILIQKLNMELEDISYGLASLRHEKEQAEEDSRLKESMADEKYEELEEHLEQSIARVRVLEGSLSHLQKEKRDWIEREKELEGSVRKKEKEVGDLNRTVLEVEEENEELKGRKKALLGQLSDHQLRINDLEVAGRIKQAVLRQYEERNGELESLLGTMMKQKQDSISHYLEATEHLSAIESEYATSTREREHLQGRLEQIQLNLARHKEQHTKAISQLNSHQLQRADWAKRLMKLNQRIHQLEKELVRTKEINLENQKKWKKAGEERAKQAEELKQEIAKGESVLKDEKARLGLEMEKLKAELILKVEEISEIQIKTVQLEEELLVSKESNNSWSIHINSAREEKNDLLRRNGEYAGEIQSLKQMLEMRDNELQEMSNLMREMKNSTEKERHIWREKFSELEGEILRGSQSQKNKQEEWMAKMSSELQSANEALVEKTHQYEKVLGELKSMQQEESSGRKALEEKVRKLEEDKLGLIATRNNQSQKNLSDALSMDSDLKMKEAEVRRLASELDSKKKEVLLHQQKLKGFQERYKHLEKARLEEQEQARKQEETFKSYRQKANNQKWNNEREMRRLLQNFIREISEQKDVAKSIEIFRKIESTLIELCSGRSP